MPKPLKPMTNGTPIPPHTEKPRRRLTVKNIKFDVIAAAKPEAIFRLHLEVKSEAKMSLRFSIRLLSAPPAHKAPKIRPSRKLKPSIVLIPYLCKKYVTSCLLKRDLPLPPDNKTPFI